MIKKDKFDSLSKDDLKKVSGGNSPFNCSDYKRDPDYHGDDHIFPCKKCVHYFDCYLKVEDYVEEYGRTSTLIIEDNS